jgi:hypothetical protein
MNGFTLEEAIELAADIETLHRDLTVTSIDVSEGGSRAYLHMSGVGDQITCELSDYNLQVSMHSTFETLPPMTCYRHWYHSVAEYVREGDRVYIQT